MYDESLARRRLKEAIETQNKCSDEDNFECKGCPIHKKLVMMDNDPNMKVVSSVCSVLSTLKDMLVDPTEYKND